MVSTSNIYVSVTQAKDKDHRHGYRRPQHIWMLSVEPHHMHIPGTPRKETEPIHYTAKMDEASGVYTIKVHQPENEPSIIGNILIAESAHTSAEQFQSMLEDVLGPKSSGKSGVKDSDDPEHWIRTALHAMHERNIAEKFNLEEFMTFAHGYEANRIDKEAPALVAYPKIHKDHEKKANKHKFWISHPMANRTKTNQHGEATTYGGLM